MRDVVALLMLLWHIRREKPDIVHTHTSKAGILGRLARGSPACPTSVIYPKSEFAIRVSLTLPSFRIWCKATDTPKPIHPGCSGTSSFFSTGTTPILPVPALLDRRIIYSTSGSDHLFGGMNQKR